MDIRSAVLGIELGSTRIKAVLIDRDHIPVAEGAYDWENRLENGIWTYSMEDAKKGIQQCYAALKEDIKTKFNIVPDSFAAIGISGMMHGYLPFDKDGNQLTEFRTWRNTITGEAAEKLTELFGFNIPQRWSIAHIYQAVLNKEEHVKDLDFVTSLAGYLHWLMTGQKVVGMNEASGMFPIDCENMTYDQEMIDKFNALEGHPWKIEDILPKLLLAGEDAGNLTEEGAKLLDPSGDLKPGIPLAPPEGDGGTGMAATNSVREKTGNVSAGTSDFAMVVTRARMGVHREIDIFNTPSGVPVAMVHCNNCTTDINAWAGLFGEFAKVMGYDIDKNTLYTRLFEEALKGDADCGGLLSYNYYSGEGVTDLDEGRPLFTRTPDAKFNLANFMRMHLLSALATLKIGMDILTEEEKVPIEVLYGHGGFFKTPGVGQRMLSAAVGTSVSVMETAGEGGPYGMALLAAYMVWKSDGESLEDYLDKKVFANAKASQLMADPEDIAGFNRFLDGYKAAFELEKKAVELIK